MDGIITVVDAKYGMEHFQDPNLVVKNVEDNADSLEMNTAVKQIALADMILLNKVDMVSIDKKNSIVEVAKGINASATLIETEYSRVNLDHILDLHAVSFLFLLESARKKVNSRALGPFFRPEGGVNSRTRVGV